jgi:hypothetical protein
MIHNSWPMYGSLRDQNLKLVRTIPSESALTVEPRVRTTLSKVGKVDTSSVEAPMTQALVA